MNHNIKLHKVKNLDPEGGIIIYITCKINGEKVNLIIDTGASKTCIGQKCYERINKDKQHYLKENIQTVGLGTTDHMSKLVKVDTLQFNRLKIKDYELVLLDWDGIGDYLEENINITLDGVLGCDLLDKYDAIIDFSKETLRLRSSL
ncbi:MAG: aspartyl protease family protein [Bacteroidales bacterium]